MSRRKAGKKEARRGKKCRENDGSAVVVVRGIALYMMRGEERRERK